MHIDDLHAGMWIEHQDHPAEVIGIDRNHQKVTIQLRDSNETKQVNCQELHDEPQLHCGCHHYY